MKPPRLKSDLANLVSRTLPIPVSVVCLTFLLSNFVLAQGIDVVQGSFGSSVGADRVIPIGDNPGFNITIKSLFADECNVTVSLEVEAKRSAWQDQANGLPINGSALVGSRRFGIAPNESINVILSWDTNMPAMLRDGRTARAQKGEFHIEFERDDCDGGGGAPTAVLYSPPYDFNVTCRRSEIDLLGGCVDSITVILSVAVILVAASVGVYFWRRMAQPPPPRS